MSAVVRAKAAFGLPTMPMTSMTMTEEMIQEDQALEDEAIHAISPQAHRTRVVQEFLRRTSSRSLERANHQMKVLRQAPYVKEVLLLLT